MTCLPNRTKAGHRPRPTLDPLFFPTSSNPAMILMKIPSLTRHFALSVVPLLLGLAAFATPSRAAEAGFQSLFNGKDLTGWEGNLTFWSVRDGAITGQTTAEHPLKTNTFLIWTAGEVQNFELRAQFQLLPNNEKNFAHSVIQYRMHIIA